MVKVNVCDGKSLQRQKGVKVIVKVRKGKGGKR